MRNPGGISIFLKSIKLIKNDYLQAENMNVGLGSRVNLVIENNQIFRASV